MSQLPELLGDGGKRSLDQEMEVFTSTVVDDLQVLQTPSHSVRFLRKFLFLLAGDCCSALVTSDLRNHTSLACYAEMSVPIDVINAITINF